MTVAIPVRDGGHLFGETLAAVRAQRLDRPLELLVADSSSSDGSRELALAHGAHVVDVAPAEFSHGGTRNMLARRAAGAHVAFLTQDAVPADELWLARLLSGFELANDVALVFGPYRPRPEASNAVRRELREWFDSLACEGRPCIQRAPSGEHALGLGRETFFSDANGCVKKSAWAEVPFRAVPYAEDRLLSLDMLAAGYAKVYHPDAAVIHSHDYRALEQFRRAFDEARALRAVYGQREPLRPDRIAHEVRRGVRGDLAAGGSLAGSLGFHVTRTAGRGLGSRADRVPSAARRALSLEGRG